MACAGVSSRHLFKEGIKATLFSAEAENIRASMHARPGAHANLSIWHLQSGNQALGDWGNRARKKWVLVRLVSQRQAPCPLPPATT